MEFEDPSSMLDAFLHSLPDGRSVGLADPAAPPEPGEVVLVLPGSGVEPVELIGAAARAGAAAVVLPAGPAVDTAMPIGRTGLVVVRKPDAVSWRQLHTALSARLDRPRLVADDDLADLAQTIATLTGGLVTIEDTAARVLAYSRSSDEVDELRRLSILGRSGPADYLALLREWGIYDRLATPEEVVEIAEHPDTGVRRRLAVGVFAGERQLGTIWVQQGATEFGPHARQALLGAARLTADQLVGRGPHQRGSASVNRLSDLLTGRADPESLNLGRDAGRPCAVAVLVPGIVEGGSAEQTQRLDELAALVTVQAAAFRRRALVERSGNRLLILLPALAQPVVGGQRPTISRPVVGGQRPTISRPAAGDPSEAPEAEAMLEQTVTVIRRHLDPAARASLGPVVANTARAADSARGAELVRSVQGDEPVLSFGRARNRLLIRAVQNFLDGQADLEDPRVTELISRDAASAHTLLRYLDTGSDVGRVAAELAVHPTTVRYRLRRISAALGIDLADPTDRLAIQLQLCRRLRSRPLAG
jgi:PucR C-terminal helix-turn-helix domain